MDRHKDRAFTFALRIVGNREEAEELLQDSFVRAYQGLDGFRGDARFSTWFYRIVYNVCITHAGRKNEREVEWDVTSLADGADLIKGLEEKDLCRLVGEEIRRLPDQFKTAITLFYVQDLSYEEIAAITDAPLGTVKTNLSRGRTALRLRVRDRLGKEIQAA